MVFPFTIFFLFVNKFPHLQLYSGRGELQTPSLTLSRLHHKQEGGSTKRSVLHIKPNKVLARIWPSTSPYKSTHLPLFGHVELSLFKKEKKKKQEERSTLHVLFNRWYFPHNKLHLQVYQAQQNQPNCTTTSIHTFKRRASKVSISPATSISFTSTSTSYLRCLSTDML